MAKLPTRLDLFEAGRLHVLTRARRIDPKQVDVAGSDVNILVGSGAVVSHAVVRQLGERMNALLLDGAAGEDLDRAVLEKTFGQVPRKGASPALGTVLFSRKDALVGAGSIPAGTVVNSLENIEYVTLADAVFSAGAVVATTDARAAQAGKAFQVGANQIRRFRNQALVFDQSIEVNNPERTAGGEDPELDEVYRERARDFFNSTRRGTLFAIEAGARSVLGVESARATEVLTPEGDPGRLVQLFVADSSGVASQALLTRVMIQLEEFRAGGIQVLGVTSQPQIVSLVLALTFVAGVDTLTLSSDIRNAVVNYVNSLGVGDPLLVNEIAAVLVRFRGDGLVLSASTVVAPVGDLVPDSGFTLRTTGSNVTFQ